MAVFGKRWRGFSLVELTIVILIAGLLAIVIIPRMNRYSAVLDSEIERLARDIRLTQTLAQTRGEPYRISFQTTLYFISNKAGTSDYSHPATGQVNTLFNDGITLTPNGSNILFDTAGAPTFTSLGSPATITLTATDGATRSVVVTANTGKVTVQ